MISILFWIAIGAFIGWNFKQPKYAAQAQVKIISLFGSLRAKFNK